MKALIMAAGIGSRLRPLTNEKPKCMVEINGKMIIDVQLEALSISSVEQIIIVTGYKGEVLEQYITDKYKHLNIIFVHNKDYLTTNNMYSFNMAYSYLNGEEFISLNADVFIEIEIINSLIEHSGSNLIAAQKNTFSPESMKVIIDKSNGTVTHISKEINNSESYGCSIDIYKYSKSASEKMFDITNKYISEENVNLWTEVALDKLIEEIEFYPFDIGTRRWFEVDSLEDLKEAEELFKYVKS